MGAASRARRRASARALAYTPELARAFIAAIERWQACREETHEECPACGALVVIEPGDEESHYSHRIPVCPQWLLTLEVLGAHSPRERTIAVG